MKSLNLKSRSDASTLPNIIIVPNVLQSVSYLKMTEEQHKEMRDLYTFVLKKYFEIIPIDKQYGITQWCATDSPKDSGWRPGLPVGLWDLNYLRKHTYAGFAAGLGAPEYWNDAK